MTIREHLDTIEATGFYSALFPAGSEGEHSFEEARMQAELSFAFPLLSDSGKAVLHIAWSANRSYQLATNSLSPRETSFDLREAATTEADVAQVTVREAVERLIEKEQFTDAQVEFIAGEMLGMTVPTWATTALPS